MFTLLCVVSYDEHPRSDAFFRLDSDSLTEIFEYVVRSRSLCNLSSTCKWIREASKPVLFRTCHIIMLWEFDYRRLVPATLWPHIQYVSTSL